MRGELDTYARHLRWILDQVVVSLKGLTPAQLNWRPSKEANSAYAIVNHLIESTRVYALGFGCGLPVERDRRAEFSGVGEDVGALIARVGQFEAELLAALAAVVPTVLDERSTPSEELWGVGEPHEIARRDALVESIRHGGIHLGELRLTRDLAVQHAGALS